MLIIEVFPKYIVRFKKKTKIRMMCIECPHLCKKRRMYVFFFARISIKYLWKDTQEAHEGPPKWRSG